MMVFLMVLLMVLLDEEEGRDLKRLRESDRVPAGSYSREVLMNLYEPYHE
jgi:hypothetical protein